MPRRAAALAIFAGAAAALLWRCPFAVLTRVPCPACGTTRALGLLVRGHVRASLSLQPMAVPLCLALLAGLALEVPRASLLGPRARRVAESMAIVIGLAAMLVWAARFFGACGGPVGVG